MRGRNLSFIVTLLLSGMIVLGAATRAEAYYGVVSLSYNGEEDSLSGYAGVFREPWDPSFYYYYEGACECYIYYESWVGELGRVWRPSGSLVAAAANQAIDYVYFALPPFEPDEGGNWLAQADHAVYHHYWEPSGAACGYTPCEMNYTDSWWDQDVAAVPGACADPTATAMRQEYIDRPEVGFVPFCGSFKSSGGSQHFSWSELNGGWAGGNESGHNPWGLVTDLAVAKVEETRSIFNNGGIVLSSGYRCPIGNANVGGVNNSRHMYGQAMDLYASVYCGCSSWSEAEFNELRDAAASSGATELLNYSTYSDHHLHAAWEY